MYNYIGDIMSTKICLIRHGQTNWNKQKLIQGRIDNLLNNTGRIASREAAKKIKELNINWEVFLSSPLKRAYETAEIIKKELNFFNDIIIIPDLTEREFGVLEGKKVCEESYKLMDEGVEGLEMLHDLQTRAVNTILKIANDYKDKRVLVATHSQFIKGLLSYIIKDFNFRCVLKNNSLTMIEVENNIIKVISYEAN